MEERQPVGVDGGDGNSAVLTEYRRSAADAARSLCPFLIAATGDWRLAAPTREHRCAAFAPLTSLSLDKQARLCLAASHVSCATYKASVGARAERAGAGEPEERAGRWGLARTAPLIEDTGGLLGTLITMIADRRTWPAIPAVLLVATLIAVGISGVRGEGQAAAVATATPGATPGAAPTEPSSPVPTLASSPPPTGAPSPQASGGPAASGGPTPAPSYLIYTVQTGDTLSSIATKFHTTVSALEKLNNITNPRSLHVGQKLKIP
jgi:hypothetical protein